MVHGVTVCYSGMLFSYGTEPISCSTPYVVILRTSGNKYGNMRAGTTRSTIIQMWKVRREKYRLPHSSRIPQSLRNVDVLVRRIFVDTVRVLAHETNNLFVDLIASGFGEDGTGIEQLLLSSERCSGY